MTKAKGKGAKKRATQPPPAADSPPKPPVVRRPFSDDHYLEDMCAFIGDGGSLRSWATQTGHAPESVVRWIQADAERQRTYREARKMQADAHIDGLIELADSPIPTDAFGRTDSAAVQQLRLKVDTRKWVAAKFYPSLYGDRVAVDANIDVGTLKPDEVMGKIVALLANHGLRVAPDETDGSGPAA